MVKCTLGSFINGKMYFNLKLGKGIGPQARVFPAKMKDFDGYRFKVAAFDYPPKVKFLYILANLVNININNGKWF